MIVAAAEGGRLNTGHGAQEIIELVSTGVRRSVDLFSRQQRGGRRTPSDRFRRARCADDEFVGRHGRLRLGGLGGRLADKGQAQTDAQHDGPAGHPGRYWTRV